MVSLTIIGPAAGQGYDVVGGPIYPSALRLESAKAGFPSLPCAIACFWRKPYARSPCPLERTTGSFSPRFTWSLSIVSGRQALIFISRPVRKALPPRQYDAFATRCRLCLVPQIFVDDGKTLDDLRNESVVLPNLVKGTATDSLESMALIGQARLPLTPGAPAVV